MCELCLYVVRHRSCPILMNKFVVLLLIFVAANPHVMFAQKTVWITQALKMGMKRFVFRKGPGLYR